MKIEKKSIMKIKIKMKIKQNNQKFIKMNYQRIDILINELMSINGRFNNCMIDYGIKYNRQ